MFLSRSSVYYDYTGERNEYGLFQLNRCMLYTFGGILQQGGAAALPTADSGKSGFVILILSQAIIELLGCI